MSDREYEYSTSATKHLTGNIIKQEYRYHHDPESKKCKNAIKIAKKEIVRNILNSLEETVTSNRLKVLELHQEQGASIWLTSLPLKDEGYVINKQNFVDLIRLRYDWHLNRFPDLCECGSKFTVEHALLCKKGGFVTLRHNKVRNITAKLLREVCKDVKVEPQLQPLTVNLLNRKLQAFPMRPE